MNSTEISLKKKTKSNRKSGIELLRIFAAISVILLHYNSGRAFNYVQDGSLNKFILFVVESLCICAVDLFVIISGYFLGKSNKRSVGKIAELFVQVIAFRLAYYFATVIFTDKAFSLKGAMINLVPNSYYVILYSTLYFVSPYINVMFEKLSSKARKNYIITILVLFSLWPVCHDLSGELLSKEWFGLSTIGAWGNQQGFNIVNFVLIYSIGAYLQYDGIPPILNKTKNLLICVLACVGIILMWSLGNEFLTLNGLRSAWVYHNPLVILLAVSLFGLFSKMNFQSKAINELAKASFTCFLIHGYFLDFVKIKLFVNQPFYFMLFHMFVCAVGIYLISWVVYKIYALVTGRYLKGLERIVVPNIE